MIVYCLSSPPSVGAPHYAMAAIELVRRGHELVVLCIGRGEEAVIRTPLAELPVRWITPGRRVGELRGMLGALRRARREFGDRAVYYVNGSENTPAALLGLSGVPRQRIVYHTQDFLEPGRHRHYEWFEKRFARRAGRVIVNEVNRGRALKSLYRLGAMPDVVNTALPGDWPIPQYEPAMREELLGRFAKRPPDDAIIVFSQGGFGPVRCSAELIAGMGRLPARYVLVMTSVKPGSASERLAIEHAERAGCADRLLQLPYLEYGELLRYTAGGDMGVLLYPNDGIGNFYQMPGRLTSYVGAGVPVLASHFPGLELMCLKHGIGEVCDPTSPQSIATAIEALGEGTAEPRAERRARIRRVFLERLAYELQFPPIERAVVQAAGA